MDMNKVLEILKEEERVVLPLSMYRKQEKALAFLSQAGVHAEIVKTVHKYAGVKREISYHIRRIN